MIIQNSMIIQQIIYRYKKGVTQDPPIWKTYWRSQVIGWFLNQAHYQKID